CATAATCASTDKNKSGSWTSLEDRSACRLHRSALSSRACWLVLRSVKAPEQTGFTSGCDSRKIDCCFAVRKPQRGKGQRLLRRRHPGRDSDTPIKDRRSKSHLAHIHSTLQKRPG